MDEQGIMKSDKGYSVALLNGLIVLVFGWSTGALAGLPPWQCVGDPVTTYNVGMDLELPSGGQVNSTTSDTFSAATGFRQICNCPVRGDYYGLYSATTSLPIVGDGWLQLNDTIEAQVFVDIWGPGATQVPYTRVLNKGPTKCDGPDFVSYPETGREGRVNFRLRKSIVGIMTFSGRLATLYTQFEPATGQPDPLYPHVYIDANISLRGTATCQFRAGDQFSIDLGQIEKSTLIEGGPPRSGFTPQTLDLSVDCVGAGISSAIKYQFDGLSGHTGDLKLMRTNLRGVGIGFHDGNDQPIGFGVDKAFNVPVVNNSTSLLIKPYPSKIAGEVINNGAFEAQAVITLSLP